MKGYIQHVCVEIICPLKQRWHSHGRDQVSPATQQHHKGCDERFVLCGQRLLLWSILWFEKKNRLVKNAVLETLGQVVTTALWSKSERILFIMPNIPSQPFLGSLSQLPTSIPSVYSSFSSEQSHDCCDSSSNNSRVVFQLSLGPPGCILRNY